MKDDSPFNTGVILCFLVVGVFAIDVVHSFWENHDPDYSIRVTRELGYVFDDSYHAADSANQIRALRIAEQSFAADPQTSIVKSLKYFADQGYIHPHQALGWIKIIQPISPKLRPFLVFSSEEYGSPYVPTSPAQEDSEKKQAAEISAEDKTATAELKSLH